MLTGCSLYDRPGEGALTVVAEIYIRTSDNTLLSAAMSVE